jgi:DNA polymerase I-like protein with 3'-5' exonuclease and polymerase domains
MSTLFTRPSVVTVTGQEYPYIGRWSGQRLLPGDGYLAFDTETEVVDHKRQIPRLALASASAGDRANCLIHPEDLGEFLLAHKGLHFICHNAAFDFWCVEQHLRRRGEGQALQAWWEVAEKNRLHDSMLLDMLVRLARDDSFPDPRDLAVVARHYAGLDLAKDDPYRLRYGDIIGKEWEEVEEEFFAYAVKDAVVTRTAYLAIRTQALALVEEYGRSGGDILPDARQRFGLLTEAVQVKKAIALAQITRNGMHLDQEWVRKAEADLRQRLREAVAQVRTLCPDLYKTDAEGGLACTGKAQTPSKSTAALVGQLQRVVEEVRQAACVEPHIPVTKKTRRLSTSKKFWQEYQDYHPFLRHWIAVEDLAKLVQFFAHLRQETVHPSYSILVRTGRTACVSPNVQQVPRDSAFRQAFVPSPGHLLLAVDYSFVELCTLAAHALHRYGRSDLADVIKSGVDPHAHTGAIMSGVPLEVFLSWKDKEAEEGGRKLRDRYDAARQAAKAINFGVPGGLGAQRLLEYARSTYRVTLTSKEAQTRRDLLTKTVYRELDDYLSEDGVAIIARNLRAPLWEVRNELGDLHLSCVRKVLAGDPKRRDGQPYQPTFVSRVWASLAGLNRDPELKEALAKRQPGEALAARVCHAGVATLTGRIRGRVGYSQARNTPFQGLAADGAALALFDLVKEGFRVVGFVHDEVLVELPDEGGYVSEEKVRRVEDILRRNMEGVLVGGIPVGCEAALSRRWNKKAKRRAKDGRVYPWEPPAPQTVPAEAACRQGMAADPKK